MRIDNLVKKLTSKQQHWYYEQGEFSEIADKSLKETMVLIREFPWEGHRNEMMIGLNGPSVTIEDGAGAFIKIGQYYNGRYMLYYLNGRDQIFCRIAESLAEFEKDIAYFFDQGIDESGINKYRAGVKGKRKYFETGIFEYEVGARIMLRLMILPIFFAGLTLLLSIFAALIGKEQSPLGVFLFLSFISLFFVLPHSRFLWNYYFFSRKLLIRVSRGADLFYFGKKGSVSMYSKSEIRTIRTYNNKKYSSRWSEFYAYEIEMSSGEVLKFTNLMMTSWMLHEKFPQVIINDKHKTFPFVFETKS